MEIISYVGYDNRNYRSGFDSSARHFIKHFAEHVHEKITDFRPKLILVKIGKTVSSVQKNAARISFVLAAAAVFFAAVFGGIRILKYFKEHTNPLVLQSESAEMEILDSLMKAFAKEETPEYLSDGSLVNLPENGNETDISKYFSQPVSYQTYTVKSGDTISGITRKFGLKNISTIIGINKIENVRLISAGTKLQIPSVDGLTYTVQSGNTLQGLSAKFNVSMEELLDVNELESASLQIGQKLFIPGARMESDDLLSALGELFKNPLHSKFRYTSMFGPRTDPISGAKSSHTGIDMACPSGTPIYSSSAGTVAFAGYSNIFGNYVIVKHANGYQTLYAHLSKITAKKGERVSQETKIGLVGSTGYSTGPHLHFTVYKNGKLVDPMTMIKK